MPKNLSSVIIDDELGASKNLTLLLASHCPHIEVVATAQDTLTGEKLIAEHQPQIVFLDIEMPKETGIEFIKRIWPISFELVFVTAYDEYAIKAFKLNALDYILKPINPKYLKGSMQRLTDQFTAKSKFSIVGNQRLEIYTERKHSQYITLPYKTDYLYVPFRDILYIEALGAYCKFHLVLKSNVSEIMASHNLAYYEELLPAQEFIRAHRGFLVNINHVVTLREGLKNFIVLQNSTKIPVSRRKLAKIKSHLK